MDSTGIGVGVGVDVGVDVGIGVDVGLGVTVGPRNCPGPQPESNMLITKTDVAIVMVWFFIVLSRVASSALDDN